MNHLLILAGFLAPYATAIAAFPLLASSDAYSRIVPFGACLLIAWSSWIIPAEIPILRFLASISAAMLALKVVDVSLDFYHRRIVTWQQYVDFLSNPFTLVRRKLADEPRPSAREDNLHFLRSSTACAISIFALSALFRFNWSGIPFLVEHIAKATSLMFALSNGLTAAAALWRLGGGNARDFMDRPFVARTPAEFWRCYNRNVQQFFLLNVFSGNRSRRAPIRAMLLVFGLSALLHELLFFSAVGSVQGYQTAFFAIQGLAAAATARIKVRSKLGLPWVFGTMIFNVLTSVLFFASIHNVTPFYSQELPRWLQGW